jgi:hypothetical protein
MEFHEIAELFPEMAEEEFAEHKADIAANGQLDPIATYQGKKLISLGIEIFSKIPLPVEQPANEKRSLRRIDVGLVQAVDECPTKQERRELIQVLVDYGGPSKAYWLGRLHEFDAKAGPRSPRLLNAKKSREAEKQARLNFLEEEMRISGCIEDNPKH